MQCSRIATALLLLLSAATAARVRRDALPLSELHAGNDASRHATHGYVYMTEQGRLQIGHGKAGHSSNSGKVLAEGSFSDLPAHTSNFGQLRVTTHPVAEDALQVRAAGYLEGYLTAERLADHVYNYNFWFRAKGNGTNDVVQWLVQQDEWIRAKVSTHLRQQQEGVQKEGRERQAMATTASTTAATTIAALTARSTAASSSTSTSISTSTSMGGGSSSSFSDGNAAVNIASSDASLRHGFWYAVSLSLQQLDGILEGYNARAAQLGPEGKLPQMSRESLLLVNAFGDMNDLLPMFVTDNDEEVTRDLSKLSPEAAWQRLVTGGHCSALIKVAGDLSDIWVGHTTWSTYYSMVRLYKHYDFSSLDSPHARGRRVSMPSYPGVITSIDDFYIVNPTKLVVLETTNDIYDTSLYEAVSYRSALSYHRVYAANLVAQDGAQWAQLAQMYHSGTYNNQWMVVDLKRFTPRAELQEGLLTVLELLPGFAAWADVTHELERGFWPSYNIPYFKEVYDRSGYPAMAAALKAKGPQYDQVVSGLSYQVAPRAKIFRRDAGAVESLHDLGKLLRHNKWGNDTYTDNDVWGTLCARGDLSPKRPTAYGCIDAKITSYAMALESASLAIGGPSTEYDLPPFSWSGAAAYAKGPHRGMPDAYNGDFELQQP